MNTKKFFETFKTIIRTEIRRTLRDEMELIKEDLLTEIRLSESIQTPTPTPTVERNTVTKTNKKFVDDPVLNEILNSTAPLGKSNDFSTLMTMTSDDAPDYNTRTKIQTTLDGRAVDIASDEKFAAINDAVNRDYSHLMKAIDKKKGKR